MCVYVQAQKLLTARERVAPPEKRKANKEETNKRVPGEGVKFHKLRASPTFGPCSAIFFFFSATDDERGVWMQKGEENTREHSICLGFFYFRLCASFLEKKASAQETHPAKTYHVARARAIEKTTRREKEKRVLLFVRACIYIYIHIYIRLKWPAVLLFLLLLLPVEEEATARRRRRDDSRSCTSSPSRLCSCSSRCATGRTSPLLHLLLLLLLLLATAFSGKIPGRA